MTMGPSAWAKQVAGVNTRRNAAIAAAIETLRCMTCLKSRSRVAGLLGGFAHGLYDLPKLLLKGGLPELRGLATPGDEARIAQAGFRLAVAQRLAARCDDPASCSFEHGLAGSGVPFHGGAEARIDVGFTSGEGNEFDRRPDARPPGNVELGEIGFRLGIEMREADQRGQPLR